MVGKLHPPDQGQKPLNRRDHVADRGGEIVRVLGGVAGKAGFAQHLVILHHKRRAARNLDQRLQKAAVMGRFKLTAPFVQTGRELDRIDPHFGQKRVATGKGAGKAVAANVVKFGQIAGCHGLNLRA